MVTEPTGWSVPEHEPWVAPHNRIYESKGEFQVIPNLLPEAGEREWKDLPDWLRVYARIQLSGRGDRTALDPLVETIRGRDIRGEVAFERDGGAYRTRFSLAGGDPVEGRWLFSADEGSPEYTAIKRLERGDCPTIANVGEVGAPLWGGLFFGDLERAFREVAARIVRARAFVLYGRSGLGKTSLLNAGIFPRLRERG